MVDAIWTVGETPSPCTTSVLLPTVRDPHPTPPPVAFTLNPSLMHVTATSHLTPTSLHHNHISHISYPSTPRYPHPRPRCQSARSAPFLATCPSRLSLSILPFSFSAIATDPSRYSLTAGPSRLSLPLDPRPQAKSSTPPETAASHLRPVSVSALLSRGGMRGW